MKNCLLVVISAFVAFSASAQTNTASLLFDGTASFVEVADAPTLNPTSALSIEAWIKPDSFGVNAYSNYIVGKDDWTTSSAGYCLRCGLGGKLSFNFSDGVGGWKEAISTAAIDTGIWSHVAGVYDGTKLTVYINGFLAGSTLYSGTIHASTYPLRIGAVPFTLGGTRLFKGQIDQVEVWNKALSPNEINQYMSCTPTGSELGLVGLWKFEEGIGTTSIDNTIFGNNATLINGMTWSTDAPALNCSVGISEYAANSYSIAPNPSTGKITLSYDKPIADGLIQIYSSFGQKCFDEKIINSSSTEILLDNLSTGIYFVKVSSRGFDSIQKLVVE